MRTPDARGGHGVSTGTRGPHSVPLHDAHCHRRKRNDQHSEKLLGLVLCMPRRPPCYSASTCSKSEGVDDIAALPAHLWLVGHTSARIALLCRGNRAGSWWTKRAKQQPFSLDVPRDEGIAFAVYTVTVSPVNGGKGDPADATLCRRNSRSMPIQPARVMVAGPRSSSRRFFGNGAIGLSSA